MPPKSPSATSTGSSLRTLSDIVKILQKSGPEENPLAHIVTLVRNEMKVDVSSLYLLQEKKLLLVATDGLDIAAVGQVSMPLHKGLAGLAAETLDPVVAREAREHPRYEYFPETREEQFHSFAAVPILFKEKVLGVLAIQTREPRDFTPSEIEMLSLISFQLAGVIENLVTLELLKGVEGKEEAPERFKGLAVSPGFGIGPVAMLVDGSSSAKPTAHRKKKKVDPKEEMVKLRRALRETTQDLRRLEKKVLKKFSKQESDIFFSHRMILADKTFQKRLYSEVEKGRDALGALEEVISDYLKIFQSVEDQHFRDRAADLEDIQKRISDHLQGKSIEGRDLEGVLVAESLVPSVTAKLDPKKIKAIVTERGGVTSHAAILARSMGIPAVMGIPNITRKVVVGDLIIVDGNVGRVYINPKREVLQEDEKIQEKYADNLVHLQVLSGEAAETKDGRKIRLEANVGLLSGLKGLRHFGAEGVGLYRTELPFMVRKRLPDEEEQFHIYKKVVEEAGGLPITFRTLDAGGDKPIAALGLSTEANPFLGYRSIRLCLTQPEILRVQLRALLRASAYGSIRILIPMISAVEEITEVRSIMREAEWSLSEAAIAFDPKVPLGMMVEVPAAVQLAPLLANYVDFLSIGTNDLIQYTLAVDRNNERVAQFFEPLHPAILSYIAQVAQVGEQTGKMVGVCGEMAGDSLMTPLLVGLGVTQLSMIPVNIPMVKRVIRQLTYSEVKELALGATQLATVREIKERLLPFQKMLA